MRSISKNVKKMLKDSELVYFTRNHGERIALMLTGKEAVYWVNIISIDPAEQLCITINDSQIILEAKRYLVSEYLTRINYGLILGNFEMDFSDGTYRFRHSIDIEDGRLSSVLIGRMLNLSLVTMERYRPGLMKILFENWTPERAFEFCRPSQNNNAVQHDEGLPELSEEERAELDAHLDALFHADDEITDDENSESNSENESVADSDSETSAESISEPNAESISETSAKSISETNAESISETGTESISETGTESISETNAESISETGTDSISEKNSSEE